MLIKNEPRRPLIIPRIMAPGITSDGVTSIALITPNFMDDAVQFVRFP